MAVDLPFGIDTDQVSWRSGLKAGLLLMSLQFLFEHLRALCEMRGQSRSLTILPLHRPSAVASLRLSLQETCRQWVSDDWDDSPFGCDFLQVLSLFYFGVAVIKECGKRRKWSSLTRNPGGPTAQVTTPYIASIFSWATRARQLTKLQCFCLKFRMSVPTLQ